MSVTHHPTGQRLSLAVRLGLQEAEDAIRDAAAACGGNTTRMARMLGVSHRTLCRWAVRSKETRGIIRAARDYDTRVIEKPR